MNTAVINIKTDPKVKAEAKEIAASLGFSLSSLVNAYLKQLTRTKAVSFSLSGEEPSNYLLKAIENANKDLKGNRASPLFDNAEEAIAWLNNPKKKYASPV